MFHLRIYLIEACSKTRKWLVTWVSDLTKRHGQWIFRWGIDGTTVWWVVVKFQKFALCQHIFKVFVKMKSSYFWVACSFGKSLYVVISVHKIDPFDPDTLELLRTSLIGTHQIWVFLMMMMMMMMIMMMMMNCFCGMVDQRKVFSLIFSRDHCQRSSPSQISDTPRAGFLAEIENVLSI